MQPRFRSAVFRISCPITEQICADCLGQLINLNNLSAPKVTAVRASPVGQNRFVAVAARGQVGGAEGVVGTTAVAATLAEFAFWQRCHFKGSLKNQQSISAGKLHSNTRFDFVLWYTFFLTSLQKTNFHHKEKQVLALRILCG